MSLRAPLPCLAVILALASVACDPVDDDHSRREAVAAIDTSLTARLARAGVVPPGRGAKLDVETAGRSGDWVTLVDPRSGLRVRYALEVERAVPRRSRGGALVYPAAVEMGDAATLLRSDGVEDVLLLSQRPSRERIRMRVDVREVAGLRLVEGVLELLDRGGAPRVRIAKPFVLDARDRKLPAELGVEGCNRDESPRSPWDLPPIAPGASECFVVLRWGEEIGVPVEYPALVDPLWQATTAMSSARSDHQATPLGNGRVLVTGANVSGDISAEIFDPLTETWSVTGAMVTPRYEHVAVALDGGSRVVALGGWEACEGCSPLASAEVYDAGTGLFTPTLGPMARTRTSHDACRLADGRVLVAGGRQVAPLTLHTVAEIYDPRADSFADVAMHDVPHDEGTLTCLPDGSALLAAGGPGSTNTERYLPATDTWVFAGALASSRRSHEAILLEDGRVALVGGALASSIDPTLDLEIFDPTKPPEEAWSIAGATQTSHIWGGVAAVTNGRLLLAGGCCSDSGSAELYDPATESWLLVGSLSIPRVALTLTKLADGRVLAAGGLNALGAVPDAEVWSLSDLGASCDVGATCGSYHCADGVCCDDACRGSCKSCLASRKGSGADGACGLVAEGELDPAGVCAIEGACGQTGRCDATGGCAIEAEGVACGEAPCPQGGATCDGTGTCVCPEVTCSEDATTFGTTACAPYFCTDGGCGTSCATSTECQAPALCDRTGHCTLPSLPAAESGVCTCHAAGLHADGSAHTLVLFLGIGAAAARRRKEAR